MKLAAVVFNYILTMKNMENTNTDGSVNLSDANAFFDMKNGEHISQHWKYQMTIDEDEDFFEITAIYLG